MRIKTIQQKHYAWLKKMRWTDKDPLRLLALVCSEIGEAVDECRGDKPTDRLPLELADIILRILGMAERLGIDMERAIAEKMWMNAKRGNLGRKK